jgi:hypothetical protein
MSIAGIMISAFLIVISGVALALRRNAFLRAVNKTPIDQPDYINLTIRFIVKNIFYPLSIISSMLTYARSLDRMFAETRDQSFLKYKKKHLSKMIYAIVAPIVISLSSALIVGLHHREDYQSYKKRLTYNASGDFIEKLNNSVEHLGLVKSKFPVGLAERRILLIGYILSILGAIYMTRTPAIRAKKNIEFLFLNSKLTDQNQAPWSVMWLTTYGVIQSDPYNYKQSKDKVENIVRDIEKILKTVGAIRKDQIIYVGEFAKPGQIKIAILDKAAREEMATRAFLEKAGLYYKTYEAGFEVIKYPKVKKEEGGDVIFEPNGSIIAKESYDRAIPLIKEQYGGEFSYIMRDGNVFKAVAYKPTVLRIPFGETPLDSNTGELKTSWNKLLDKMRDAFKKTHDLHWCLGEIRDASFVYEDTDIIVPFDLVPHMLVLGSTGSGKTETMKSMAVHLAAAYGENVEIYFGSEKGDYLTFAKYLSPTDMALPYHEDYLIEFANIFAYVKNEYDRRVQLFKTTPGECKNIQAYRSITGKVLPSIVIFIDEFSTLNKEISFQENMQSAGTIADRIDKITAVYRYSGIHLILGTQEARQNTGSMPSKLKTNLGAKLLHKSNAQDLEYLGAKIEQSEFQNGKGAFFIMGVPGLSCQVSNNQLAPVRIPYCGQSAEKLLSKITEPKPKNRPFDYDLIYNQGESKKDDVQALYKKIKKLFFDRASFTTKLLVENSSYVDKKLISVEISSKAFPNMSFYSGIVGKDDVCSTLYEAVSEHEGRAIVFVTDNLKASTINEAAEECPFLVLLQDKDYSKALAYEMQLAVDNKPSSMWLKNYINAKVMPSLGEIDDIDGEPKETDQPLKVIKGTAQIDTEVPVTAKKTLPVAQTLPQAPQPISMSMAPDIKRDPNIEKTSDILSRSIVEKKIARGGAESFLLKGFKKLTQLDRSAIKSGIKAILGRTTTDAEDRARFLELETKRKQFVEIKNKNLEKPKVTS